MNVLDFIDKPAYWFRPHQALIRGWASTGLCRHGLKDISLAWGLTIRCNTKEAIGRAIQDQGVYELVVSEVICRLVPEGGLAVDVGANIGHMTGLMAKRAGPHGHVFSFEPSSRILNTLKENVQRWNRDPSLAKITVQEVAVSAKCGVANLYYPEDLSWEWNQGTASLESSWSRPEAKSVEQIQTIALDGFFSATDTTIDLLKIDAEGHELPALTGAARLLECKRIKHIVFECVAGYPSSASALLESYGYRIYRLSRNFLRVVLHRADYRSPRPIDVVPNYLATVDVLSAKGALSKAGWSTLRG